MEKQIIASKSSIVSIIAFLSGIGSVIFGFFVFLGFQGSLGEMPVFKGFIILIVTVLLISSTIYHTISSIQTPQTLITFEQGVFHIYPTKTTHFTVKPLEIYTLDKKNYHNRGMEYSSGVLTIKPKNQAVIEVKWVQGISTVMQEIQLIKEKSIKDEQNELPRL